jgi:hypothetical protein
MATATPIPSFLGTRRGKLTLALLCAIAFLDLVDARSSTSRFRRSAATCASLGAPSGHVELVDRRQVLVCEVLVRGLEGLENRMQQWHRGSGACLNLAHEL